MLSIAHTPCMASSIGVESADALEHGRCPHHGVVGLCEEGVYGVPSGEGRAFLKEHLLCTYTHIYLTTKQYFEVYIYILCHTTKKASG